MLIYPFTFQSIIQRIIIHAFSLFIQFENDFQNNELNEQTTTHGDFQANNIVEQLTRREQQIAGLLSQGLSNKQIARDLCIELSTVKNHVHNILVKVGAQSRMQAVLILQNSILSSFPRSMDLELYY